MCWNNHARATAHSRFTVRGESPRVAAVSSTDSPAKNRRCTIWAMRGSCRSSASSASLRVTRSRSASPGSIAPLARRPAPGSPSTRTPAGRAAIPKNRRPRPVCCSVAPTRRSGPSSSSPTAPRPAPGCSWTSPATPRPARRGTSRSSARRCSSTSIRFRATEIAPGPRPCRRRGPGVGDEIGEPAPRRRQMSRFSNRSNASAVVSTKIASRHAIPGRQLCDRIVVAIGWK